MSAREKGSGRRYLVVKRLPWIEGGKPLPGFDWEGGECVFYEPGDTVYMEDRDLASTYHYLEAIDDAGRAALEEVRPRTARRIAAADLHPCAIEWLTRASDEKLRAAGSMRKLVLSMLARGEDPTDDDLAAALEESPDELLPQELRTYLVELLRGKVWRKSGRKTPPRTTAQDLHIQSVYHFVVEGFKARFAGQKRAPVKRRAAEEVARALGLTVRTVERIVAPRPWTKTRKSKT